MDSMRDDRFILYGGGKRDDPLFVLVFDMDITESLGYKDFVWAVELHRLGLELVGLWPLADEVSRKKLVTNVRVGFTFITVILVSGVPLVCALIRVWGDMVLMIDNLRITLPLIVVSFKFVIIRWKRKVLLSIVNMMAEDWIAVKLNTERDVMLKQARSARLLMLFGYVLMISAFIMLMIFPCFGIQIRHITNLTDRNKPLPLQAYYFYDTDKSPQFELTFLTQAIAITLAGIIYTSVDAFLALVVFHICGQLENLRHRLVNLIVCKNFNQALKNSIMYHLRLIRFVNNIESTFSLMIFGLVLYFCIVFCLVGFLLLTVISDERTNDASFLQVCYMAVAVMILLTHTFLYCGAGELITGQCEAIYRVLCDLEWYKLESRKARCLILLLLRTSEPFRITAGKIVPLTMASFCSLLKTSAGYISFLLAKRS
ncbi:PREDICTED: odorant receptor 43a-like [Vollenhovia emeryi]|uniref:odorant receptor 43a-like n=1 Tax=Vollenhovia emeryi TaxID=411798 RepID=UPI0005F466AB|nr:PREDICTED: odorant receptor 43a-like [Vollenhovia emeryi]